MAHTSASPFVLAHGFPYDIHAYEAMISRHRAVCAGLWPRALPISGPCSTPSGSSRPPSLATPGTTSRASRARRAGNVLRGIAGCSVGSGGRHPGKFTDEVFDRAAESFENPDFVDAVVHAYRFVHGKEAGDPALDDRERKLAGKPKIAVPCIMLDGTLDPLKPGASDVMSPGYHAGHAFPAEAPEAFAQAIIDMRSWSAAAGAVE
ncbi:hypothetical protein F4824DRAFT_504445 [Ustulina deusta]|nr:hypothetical protein F4824DRAFT_504445 [Ustulina deusta]